MSSTVHTERVGDILVVALDRPAAFNAMNEDMLEAIGSALDDAERTPEVRGLLLIGEGRAFAAGADVGELRGLSRAEMLDHPMPRLYARLRSTPLATVAAVHGFALGGGFELALACDLRVAGESAEFGLPELSLGIVPGAGGTQMLARSVGESRALDLILSGKRIRARQALDWGLVTAVHPDAELRDAAYAALERVLQHSAESVATAKRLIRLALGDDRDGHRAELEAQAELHAGVDAQEGMGAFLERRSPHFAHGRPAGTR
ncbi:MAG: enoyl-CoA hydratase/isomerase family protein [Microbacteriaceae bacterium]|nr:enoyl-CoA hydratase/isomerase family protein [Microbacteriaceae bacterium]